MNTIVGNTFPHLRDMTPAELEARRRDLVNEAKGSREALSDDALAELCAILRVLRTQTSGPPRAKRNAPQSLEELL